MVSIQALKRFGFEKRHPNRLLIDVATADNTTTVKDEELGLTPANQYNLNDQYNIN